MKFRNPTTMKIKPNEDKTEFLFLLTFHGRQQLEIEMSSDAAMILMGVLQEFQAKHRLSIPRLVRPRGKSALRVVTD